MKNGFVKQDVRFESFVDSAWPDESKFVLFGSDAVSSATRSPCLIIYYKNEIVGYSWTSKKNNGVALGYALNPAIATQHFFHWNILQCSVTEILMLSEGKKTSLTYNNHNDPNDIEQCLLQAEFKKDPQKNIFYKKIPTKKQKQLTIIKKQLFDETKKVKKVGRGYLIDTSKYNKDSLNLLMKEYNEVAWGYSNWARHETAAPDEERIIHNYVRGERGLEVGIGNGRLTDGLKENFQHLTGIDNSPQIIDNAKKTISKTGIALCCDDICNSKFPDASFDTIMFWENGLGSILEEKQRKKAVAEMVRLLQPGGRLILGLRMLPESPIGHLMIATQYKHFMGIYHTFTPDEVKGYFNGKQLNEKGLVIGDNRPAGGKQFFLIYEK